MIGLIFAIIGIGLLAYSVSTIKSYNEKNKTYKEITSVVVDHVQNDEGLEAIIVEYTVDGRAYRKQSNSYSNMPKSTGTKVQIKYNPNNPNDVIWLNSSTNIVLPLVGGLFALVGIIVVISNAKKMKSKKEVPTVQQANGLYNSADVIDLLPNNQTLWQQIVQQQQPAENQTQDTMTQNNNYHHQQNQMGNNQNNINSNL